MFWILGYMGLQCLITIWSVLCVTLAEYFDAKNGGDFSALEILHHFWISLVPGINLVFCLLLPYVVLDSYFERDMMNILSTKITNYIKSKNV